MKFDTILFLDFIKKLKINLKAAIEPSNSKDRRRSTAPPWQYSLCSDEELKNVQKIEKYYKDEEREVKNSPDYNDDLMSETSETSQISEIEEEILDELTSIERFGLEQIHMNIAPGHQAQQISIPFDQYRSDYFQPIEIMDELEDDLFLSQTAAEETCVDQKGEILPIWTPPTPPQESQDDPKYQKLELWSYNYDSTPMQIAKPKIDNQKPKSDYDLPISFFSRNGKVRRFKNFLNVFKIVYS